jgi:concentrative nucleoside transporter, CNT family
MTARWWIFGLAHPTAGQDGLVMPGLVWGALSFRLLTRHEKPRRWIQKALRAIDLRPWVRTVRDRSVGRLPKYGQTLVGLAVLVVVVAVGTYSMPETPDNSYSDRSIGFLGLFVAVFALWATSHKRSAINWRTVITGLLMQFLLGIFVLRVEAGVSCTPTFLSISSSILHTRYRQCLV